MHQKGLIATPDLAKPCCYSKMLNFLSLSNQSDISFINDLSYSTNIRLGSSGIAVKVAALCKSL